LSAEIIDEDRYRYASLHASVSKRPRDTGKRKENKQVEGKKNLDDDNRSSAMRRFRFNVFSVCA